MRVVLFFLGGGLFVFKLVHKIRKKTHFDWNSANCWTFRLLNIQFFVQAQDLCSYFFFFQNSAWNLLLPACLLNVHLDLHWSIFRLTNNWSSQEFLFVLGIYLPLYLIALLESSMFFLCCQGEFQFWSIAGRLEPAVGKTGRWRCPGSACERSSYD